MSPTFANRILSIMATMVQPPVTTRSDSYPPSPTLSTSYPDIISLKGSLPYEQDIVDSKRNFVHAEYDKSFAASMPSTAPSSPLYTHSRDSYFSTPSYSSLDPNEDLRYDEDEDQFPSFDNNTPISHPADAQIHPNASSEDLTNESQANISTPSEPANDDNAIVHEPTRHVDYLAHEWKEEDIWSSWRYIVARRKTINNSVRLENAAWRTWTKAKNNLKTISPESLNWLKDCDVTWLYGPLQIDTSKSLSRSHSPPPSQLSTCSSFLHKKPILKKKSASAAILERSRSQHSLLARASEIIRVQQASPKPGRHGIRRGGSDFSLPSYRTSSVLNTPAELESRPSYPPRYSFGSQTPSDCKHVFFNEEVSQVQAIESDADDDEKETPPQEDEFSESDEDDDGGLMMAPARTRSNRSTPRGSFSDNNKMIAPLPPSTLKYRKDTPEPPDTPQADRSWTQHRGLTHSSSQETLKPTNAGQNFLLDDDPELDADSWPGQATSSSAPDYSPYEQEEYNNPGPNMRRTDSGMFMPYDENEDEAAMNNSLFGQALYAVNTFRDIAHVVWNVGWNRHR